jgi:hypothetical protein
MDLYSTFSVLLASSLASQTHPIASFFAVTGLETGSIPLTRGGLDHPALVVAVKLRGDRRFRKLAARLPYRLRRYYSGSATARDGVAARSVGPATAKRVRD